MELCKINVEKLSKFEFYKKEDITVELVGEESNKFSTTKHYLVEGYKHYTITSLNNDTEIFGYGEIEMEIDLIKDIHIDKLKNGNL